MCLILFGLNISPVTPLVLAANRDEFFARPTATMDFWDGPAPVLAGKDLAQGGTWLGLNETGKFAALTNYRDLSSIKPNAPSRGEIIPRFLESDTDTLTFLHSLDQTAGRYNGFNLLAGHIFGKAPCLYGYSNQSRKIDLIPPGIHGLSNHLLNTAWPKVQKGKARLKEAMGHGESPEAGVLFSMLGDRSRPHDSDLPDTGVGLEWERILSSIFVESQGYGTRSSTLVIVSSSQNAAVTERTYDDTGAPKGADQKFCFRASDDIQ